MNTFETLIGSSWYEKIGAEFEESYMKNLQTFLQQQRKQHIVYPAPANVFKAYTLSPFDKTNVVIIGQDPYPHQHANGLAFSTSSTTNVPQSLRNIFKEVTEDTGSTQNSPNLERWAEQGILLLNRVLTVRAGEPASHAGKGWETFTLKTIQKLCSSWKPKVFILWGSHAGKLESVIPKHHLILKSAHPSPLSAHNGFFGSKPFTKTNEFLVRHSFNPITW